MAGFFPRVDPVRRAADGAGFVVESPDLPLSSDDADAAIDDSAMVWADAVELEDSLVRILYCSEHKSIRASCNIRRLFGYYRITRYLQASIFSWRSCRPSIRWFCLELRRGRLDSIRGGCGRDSCSHTLFPPSCATASASTSSPSFRWHCCKLAVLIAREGKLE